jgi:hypothetical protein
MWTETDQVFSVEVDSPFVRAIDTGDNIEQSGLPGTVGSDQSNNLTLGNTKGDIREDREPFETFGYFFQVK